jgi:triacylglycerol esterase/lipase EstA (alpha/beta hydrolase family)
MKKISKIISLTLAVIFTLSMCIVPAYAEESATRTIDKSKFNTDYPYIFVHGMGGWSPTNKFYSLSPYWGGGLWLSDNDLISTLNEQGVEAYAPAVGPLSSAWDRACELYAQLTGTTVDYGEAHSKEHGHDRFGFTYEPIMGESWNLKDKINLVGHSFGGATVRLFTSLLAYGCEEEIAATVNETSGLFTGGHDSVHSCITLSAPHNGTQVSNMLYDLTGPYYLIVLLYNIIGTTLGNDFLVFSLQMGHFGLTPKQGEKRAEFSLDKIDNYYTSGDNCYYDMTLRGAAELNEKIKLSENTYYYSYTTAATRTDMFGKQLIYSSVTPIFYISSMMLRMSEGKTYDGVTIEGDWAVNDGIVPLKSALYPLCDEATALSYEESINTGKAIESGRWYYMPTLVGTDHFDFCGTKDYPTSFEDFYFTMIETANSR